MISIGSFRYRAVSPLYNAGSGGASAAPVSSVDDVADTGADDGPSGVACVAAVAAASNDDAAGGGDGDDDAAAVVVAKVANGFELRVDGEPSAFGALIGAQGRVKRQLESESGARFDVPAKGSSDRSIVIRGSTASAVRLLHGKIQAILASKRKPGAPSGDFTHFLSIPVPLGERYERWLAKAKTLLPAELHSMLVGAPALHMTLVMLRLPTDALLAKAKKVLADIAADLYDAIDTRSLVCSFNSLAIWDAHGRDTLAAANVVYIRVEFESDALVRMRKLLGVLCGELQRAGLVDVVDTDVKFHVTVLNRKYADTPTAPAKPVDVRRLVGDSQGTAFGTCKLHELHLSRRHHDPATGAYICEHKIVLP